MNRLTTASYLNRDLHFVSETKVFCQTVGTRLLDKVLYARHLVMRLSLFVFDARTIKAHHCRNGVLQAI